MPSNPFVDAVRGAVQRLVADGLLTDVAGPRLATRNGLLHLTRPLADAALRLVEAGGPAVEEILQHCLAELAELAAARLRVDLAAAQAKIVEELRTRAAAAVPDNRLGPATATPPAASPKTK